MFLAQTACELGWFPERETQELLAHVDSVCVVLDELLFLFRIFKIFYLVDVFLRVQMWNGFSGPENVASGLNSPVSLILQVMER